MKKIIAAAVASAFIAPAFAVEFSGEIEYVFVDADGAANDITNDTVEFMVSHQVELESGMTVTGNYFFGTGTADSDNVADDVDVVTTDGGMLAFEGAFGKLEIGDAGGALDDVDSMAEVAPNVGSAVEIGGDHSLAFQAPVVSGLTVRASTSPEVGMTSTDSDEVAYSVSYSLEGLTVAYGVETQSDDTDHSVTAISYSMGGAKFTYAQGEDEGNTTDEDVTTMGASYTLNNLTLGVQQDEGDTDGTVATDIRYVFAKYALGEGVNVYIQQDDDNATANNDQTNIGVQFSF